MAQRLKRWESPRRQGRNDKGRGGSARKRQKIKQLKMLLNKLKSDSTQSKCSSLNQRSFKKEKRLISSLFF